MISLTRNSDIGIFRVDLNKIVNKLEVLKAINSYYNDIGISEGHVWERIRGKLDAV